MGSQGLRPGLPSAAPLALGSGEEDGGFGFDDEEGVGIGVAVGAKLLDGDVEGGGEDGEDDGAVVAADEVEAAFVLDELEMRRHFSHTRVLRPRPGRRGRRWRRKAVPTTGKERV
jgi:hypothetical protein